MSSVVHPPARGPILPPGGPFPSAPGHPNSEVLQRFAANRARPAERRAVALHLLKGCATCSAFLWHERGVPEKAYDEVIDRCCEKLDRLLKTYARRENHQGALEPQELMA